MSQLRGFDIEYRAGGVNMIGYYSAAKSVSPGVLIVPDAFGLDRHCMDVADQLAAKGYAAFALDLWGDRRQFTGVDNVMDYLNALLDDRAMWMGRVEAARQALVAQDGVDGAKTAAIGYCLGGSTVLEYARFGNDVRGVVSFHGGLDFVGAEWDAEKVKAKLLVCTGMEDPLVPWTSLTAFQENVRKGGVHWEIDIYAIARHSFTRPDAAIRSDPERSRYDPKADRRSWRAMLNFFEEIFAEE